MRVRSMIHVIRFSTFFGALVLPVTIFAAATGGPFPACPLPGEMPYVIHPEDFDCSGDDTADDTECWQAAIECAKNGYPEVPGSSHLGTVEGMSTATYYISSPLVIQDVVGGVIDGKGATFIWAGQHNLGSCCTSYPCQGQCQDPHQAIPMWKVVDAFYTRVQNMYIKSWTNVGPACPGGCMLDAAVLITNGTDNFPQVGFNIIDHVIANGVNWNGLQYGIIIQPGAYQPPDTGNDSNTVTDCSFAPVTAAGIYLEGQNAHRQIFTRVDSSTYCAAAGEPKVCDNTYYLHMKSGSFTSTGGTAHNFDTEYYIESNSGGAVEIIDSNAEGCGRFLKNVCCNSGAWNPIHVHGGRFAASLLNPDCKIVDYYGLGPISIEEMEIGGWVCGSGSTECPSGTPTPTCTGDPYLNFQAFPEPPHDPTKEGRVVIRGNEFLLRNRGGEYVGSTVPAEGWDPIHITASWDPPYPNFNRLVSFQNACLGPTGQGICRGLASGMFYSSTKFDDLVAFQNAGNGHSAYCYDCKPFMTPCEGGGTGATATRINGVWDCGGGVLTPSNSAVVTNKNLSDASNMFPASLATLSGAQTLTNKDLTTGNLFPASLATLTTVQSLSNKDLTSTTNTFAPAVSQTLVFYSGTATINSLNYLGPNTGAKSTTEGTVGVPLPAYTARELVCKASAAPASGKAWTLSVRANGATVLTCTINAGQTTCSATGAASWSSGATIALLASPTSNPSAVITCSVRVGP